MFRGSLTIAYVAGIPIRVHWTFSILLLWIFASGLLQGGTARAGLRSAAFILAVFFCVVLHELGHALAARHYGVRTRSITLLPIGGVAQLERMPQKPVQELVIAAAGPLVTAAIAAALLAQLAWRGSLGEAVPTEGTAFPFGNFVGTLAMVNVTLLLFNLLPAFPMDGGRMLRALLATRLGHARATKIAATIGQSLAIVMALVGLFSSPMLVLIALFVWIGAAAEAAESERRTALAGLTVGEAMMRRFRVLGVDDTLQAAAEELLAGSQHDFPVTATGGVAVPVVGVLTRSDLVAALAKQGLATPVREVMRSPCPALAAADPLESAAEAMRANNCPLVPVASNGQLVGLVTPENLSELVAIRTAALPRAEG
jgi:Zn-dependent protease/CBS domain-containing protein